MAKSDAMMATVSERALVMRINRALRKRGGQREDGWHDVLVLRRCRMDTRGYHELGDYYTVNTSINGINETHVDLEDLGRELGVLEKWEVLESDGGNRKPQAAN